MKGIKDIMFKNKDNIIFPSWLKKFSMNIDVSKEPRLTKKCIQELMDILSKDPTKPVAFLINNQPYQISIKNGSLDIQSVGEY